jgi:hypothetical protein
VTGRESKMERSEAVGREGDEEINRETQRETSVTNHLKVWCEFLKQNGNV